MIRTIFNARSALFLGLLMGTIPTFFAQEAPAVAQQESLPMPVDQEDGKAEKKVAAEQEAAQEEEKKKKYAAIVLPAEIPLVPHAMQLKKTDKEGRVIAETLSMADDEYETFTGQSFAELIKEAISQHKIPLIARVVTVNDGRQEVHYFDIAGIHHEITGPRGFLNPINRLQSKELSYFAYMPQLERFIWVDRYVQGNLWPVDQIHDTAMALLLTEAHDIEDNNKAREIYRYLSDYGTVPAIKNQACYWLACSLYDSNMGRNEKIEEACNLFESLIDDDGAVLEGIPEESTIYIFLSLARAYSRNWTNAPLGKTNDDSALHYAICVIDHEYWDPLSPALKSIAYMIAGEKLVELNNDRDERAILFLEKALKLLEESKDEQSLRYKASVHAYLAIAYSNEDIVETCGYQKKGDHHMMIWKHCNEALKCYEEAKKVKGFLPLMICMRYFGIGNEGNVKEALEYMEKCQEKSGVLEVIRCHRDYYHTPFGIEKDTISDREKVLKELAKKKEALVKLEVVVRDSDQDSEEVCLARAILGQIYAEKSQKAFEQSLLYAETNQQKESLLCDQESRKWHQEAQEKMGPLLKLPGTYSCASARLTCGRMALAGAIRDEKKAAAHFSKIPASFPLLASSAASETYIFNQSVKFGKVDGEKLIPFIHKKDPKFYAIQLEEASKSLSKAYDLKALAAVESQFIIIAKEAGCMDRWKAQGALKEIAERRKKLSAAAPVAAQSASMSLDSSLDGETKAKTAVASTVVAMDESSDKRGIKRKAGGEVEEVPGAKKVESAGAGSGSGSLLRQGSGGQAGPLMLVQKN